MVRGSSTVTSQKTFTSEFSVWWAANETLHLLSITLPLSLHFSLQPTAWHLPLCATVLTLQSLFADWPAPLSVPLSASINILLSITKWGKHAPVGTYSEMDACGCRYIRFQLFFFQALKEFNVSLPFLFLFLFSEYCKSLERLKNYRPIKPRCSISTVSIRTPSNCFPHTLSSFSGLRVSPKWFLFVLKQTVPPRLSVRLSHSVSLCASVLHFIHHQDNHSVRLSHFLLLPGIKFLNINRGCLFRVHIINQKNRWCVQSWFH